LEYYEYIMAQRDTVTRSTSRLNGRGVIERVGTFCENFNHTAGFIFAKLCVQMRRNVLSW
jgi:hypothetical protein